MSTGRFCTSGVCLEPPLPLQPRSILPHRGQCLFGSQVWPRIWADNKKCSGRDLNPHALRHTPLKRTCLPISPPEQIEERNFYSCAPSPASVLLRPPTKNPLPSRAARTGSRGSPLVLQEALLQKSIKVNLEQAQVPHRLDRLRSILAHIPLAKLEPGRKRQPRLIQRIKPLIEMH